MSDKKTARLRRARNTRAKIRQLGANRLSVHRTSQHIYAQIISGDNSKVIVSASTLDASLRSGATSNVEAAKAVGKLVAERAKQAGVEQVAFDRSGFKYHGRIKALAESAREAGLQI